MTLEERLRDAAGTGSSPMLELLRTAADALEAAQLDLRAQEAERLWREVCRDLRTCERDLEEARAARTDRSIGAATVTLASRRNRR